MLITRIEREKWEREERDLEWNQVKTRIEREKLCRPPLVTSLLSTVLMISFHSFHSSSPLILTLILISLIFMPQVASEVLLTSFLHRIASWWSFSPLAVDINILQSTKVSFFLREQKDASEKKKSKNAGKKTREDKGRDKRWRSRKREERIPEEELHT